MEATSCKQNNQLKKVTILQFPSCENAHRFLKMKHNFQFCVALNMVYLFRKHFLFLDFIHRWHILKTQHFGSTAAIEMMGFSYKSTMDEVQKQEIVSETEQMWTCNVTLYVHICSGRNRIIPLMRRPNTDSTPNKPVTLQRNQLLIRYAVTRVPSTLSR